MNEEVVNLAHKVGDVLTSIHDLQQDMGGMGARHIAKAAEDIVGQIRIILHSQWSTSQTTHLKNLQKIGVALMKAIDEKGDLKELINGLAGQLEDISSKLGEKTNDLTAPPLPGGDAINPQDMQITGQDPQQAPPQQPSMPDPNNPQTPPPMQPQPA